MGLTGFRPTPQDVAERLKEINLKVNEALRSIGNVIVVMSGKGGVGKSVISAAISIALTYLKRDVGLLDADIHGPSIPWILGIESKHMYVDDTGKIVPVIAKGGVKVVSIELALESRTSPVAWRGPLKTKAILDLITLTNWGLLDYLVVDLPPGTGDEALTITRYLKPKLRGIVLVLTPGKMVAHVVTKAKNFAYIVGAKVLGAVINMSYIKCPCCNALLRPFGSLGHIDVEILEELPLDGDLAKAVDEGNLADFMINNINGNEWVRKIFSLTKKLVREVEGKEL